MVQLLHTTIGSNTYCVPWVLRAVSRKSEAQVLEAIRQAGYDRDEIKGVRPSIYIDALDILGCRIHSSCRYLMGLPLPLFNVIRADSPYVYVLSVRDNKKQPDNRHAIVYSMEKIQDNGTRISRHPTHIRDVINPWSIIVYGDVKLYGIDRIT